LIACQHSTSKCIQLNDWPLWSWSTSFSCQFHRLLLLSLKASSWHSLICCAWIILQLGSAQCILVVFWAASSRSNTFTLSFTSAGFMNLAMFSSGSGFKFSAFALTPLWSSFPSQFCQLPFARCFSFGLLHFPIIFSAKSPILLLFALLTLSFLLLAFSLFTP
jgi:hypothetical protein